MNPLVLIGGGLLLWGLFKKRDKPRGSIPGAQDGPRSPGLPPVPRAPRNNAECPGLPPEAPENFFSLCRQAFNSGDPDLMRGTASTFEANGFGDAGRALRDAARIIDQHRVEFEGQE